MEGASRTSRYHPLVLSRKDRRWEQRMIERVKAHPVALACIGCGYLFLPRYLGEQVCSECRQWK